MSSVTKKFTSVLLSATILGGICVPHSARAAWLIDTETRQNIGDAWSRPGYESNGAFLVVCVFIFPICLWDAKQSGAKGHITTADLKDQGYTTGEIHRVQSDQVALVAALAKQGKRLQIQKNETRSTLRSSLKQVYPKVSDTYVQFFTDHMGTL